MKLDTDRVVTKCAEAPDQLPQFKWQARPTSWEVGDPIGWGPTEFLASQDLLEKIQERIEYIQWANCQKHLL